MNKDIEDKIDNIINNSSIEYEKEDIICKIAEIILYNNYNDNDIFLLNKNIGFSNMLKVFKIFSGKKKQFINYDKIYEALIFAFIFYYKELYIDIKNGKKGLNWNDIGKKLSINIDNYKTRYITIKNKINNMVNIFLNINKELI